MTESEAEKKRFLRKTKIEHPFSPIDVSVEVAQKISENGGSLKKDTLSDLLGVKGGAFAGKLTAARRYGLVEGTDPIKITKLAQEILNPIKAEEDIELKIKAVLSIPIFNKIYSTYGSELPNNKILSGILLREHQVPTKSIDGTIRVLKQNLKALPDLSKIKDNPNNLLKLGDNTNEPKPDAGLNVPDIKKFGKNRFIVQVISPYDNYTKEVTDEIDWIVVEAVVKGMKEKWIKTASKEQEEK